MGFPRTGEGARETGNGYAETKWLLLCWSLNKGLLAFHLEIGLSAMGLGGGKSFLVSLETPREAWTVSSTIIR